MLLKQVGIPGQVAQIALAARRGISAYTKHPQKRGPRVEIHAGVNGRSYCMPSLLFVKRPNAMGWVGGVKRPEAARISWHMRHLEPALRLATKPAGVVW